MIFLRRRPHIRREARVASYRNAPPLETRTSAAALFPLIVTKDSFANERFKCVIGVDLSIR